MKWDEHNLYLLMLLVYGALLVMAIPVGAGIVPENLLKYVLIPLEFIGAVAILIMGLAMVSIMYRKKQPKVKTGWVSRKRSA